jgi:starch synthase
MSREGGALEIWMAAAEVSPLAQTGGLADVLRALPAALVRQGHHVRVFLPAYGRIDRSRFSYAPAEDHLDVELGIGRVPVRLLTMRGEDGVVTTLVQNEELFGREDFYGTSGSAYPDNARRFALLAQAVVALAERSERPPDVLHGHDWHAGLLPLFAWLAWPLRGRPATVLTIHNMGYQGQFGAEEMDWIALDPDLREALFRFNAIEFQGGINFLKASLQFADRLTAVSPRYAWEITTREGGFGLHEAAWRRRDHLTGILNGADYEHWDPRRDPKIPVPYDAESIERKEESRRALRAAFRLAPAGAAAASGAAIPADPARGSASGVPDRPLLGAVSRLVDQKGIDVLLEAAPALLRAGADLVVLGAGEGRIVDGLERLRREHPDRVGLFIGFDEPLSHLIVAGSDLLLVPSRYEPCGLVQMHAMRYGTIPVVHRTGGLADTVRDETAEPQRGTGFVFEGAHAGALAHAVHRALTLRAESPVQWRSLQRRAMAEEFSWDRSAALYLDVYRSALI